MLVQSPQPQDFRLLASLVDPACGPTDASCVDEHRLSACHPDGTGYQTIYCADPCADASCTPATGEVCADPWILTGPTTLDLKTKDFTDDFATVCGQDAPGADLVLQVDLAAGDVLTARVRGCPAASSGANGSFTYGCASPNEPMLHLAAACPVEAGCLASAAEVTGTDWLELTHTAAAGGTYFLVVDDVDPGVFGRWHLEVDVGAP